LTANEKQVRFLPNLIDHAVTEMKTKRLWLLPIFPVPLVGSEFVDWGSSGRLSDFDVRRDEAQPAMIVAADSYLHGVLLKQLFEAKPEYRGLEEGYSLQQRLVSAFGGCVSDDDAIEEAKSVYTDFEAHAGDRAIVCLGSIKSNPVIEIPISRTFGATAFQPQDNVNKASQRSCPFFMRYRDHDPQAPSCYAGTVLAKSKRRLSRAFTMNSLRATGRSANGTTPKMPPWLCTFIVRPSKWLKSPWAASPAAPHTVWPKRSRKSPRSYGRPSSMVPN
jgi:hypothetical protein